MAKTAHRGLVATLGQRDFRLLMAGYSVSAAGSWAYNVGLAVYVYERTHSAAWVGAATIGRFVPCVLFGSYGGVVAERFERARLMVALDAICALLMTALSVVAAYHGAASLAIGIGAVNSLVSMAYQPAVAAITPQLVPEDNLAAANTLTSTVANLAVVAGPAIGALLLLIGTPVFAFAANALSFCWSALVVSRISSRSTPVDVTSGGSVGLVRQMMVGAQAIVTSPTATVLAAYSVVASFVYGVDTVLLVILSERRLGTGANGYGYLLAGLGVGGVLAAGLVKRISARPRLGTAIILAMAVYCLPTLALLTVREPATAFAVEVVRGAGTLVVDVLAMTALQRSLPQDKLGRVFGAFFTFVLTAISLGALVTPLVLNAAGLDATLWLAGGLIPALCLIGWPWLHRMDEVNVAQLAEIAPRVALLQRAAILAESSRSTLERLAKESTMLSAGTGEDVVREGDEPDSLYVIETGTMRVRSHVGTAEERELACLGPGDYFGEIGLIHHIPRTATVTATSPSRLLRMEGTAFLEALSSGVASPSLLEGAQARLASTLGHLSPLN
jgi:MFS family permease